MAKKTTQRKVGFYLLIEKCQPRTFAYEEKSNSFYLIIVFQIKNVPTKFRKSSANARASNNAKETLHNSF